MRYPAERGALTGRLRPWRSPLQTPSHYTPAVPTKRYRAFISYSRKDEVWARRIHAALEAYRAPRGIGAHVDHKTRRLGRIFRDDDEMPAAQSLSATIESALAQAETLIVICSPHSAQSAWVDTEVRRFRTDPKARVLAVIVGGTPNATIPEDECFCPGLRWRVASDGRLTNILDEPLAPDIRREGMERVIARLAAGILGVNFDLLWRRHARRAGRQRISLAAVAVTVACVVVGIMAHLDTTTQNETNATALSVATKKLAAARHTGDVSAMETVLRLAVIAAETDTYRAAANELIVDAIAATRTEWRTQTQGGALNQVAFSLDSEVIYTLSERGRATVWNMKTGREVTRVDLRGAPVGMAPDGAFLLVSGEDGALLWRSDNWAATILADSHPTCADFSQTTATLVTCEPNGGARIWRTETGVLVQTISNDGPAWTDARYDASGERILFSSGHGAWSIWDAEAAETAATLLHNGRSLSWATPGIYNYFVAGLGTPPYGAAITPTGAAPLSGHNAPVTVAQLFGDGVARMRLASGDAHGRLMISAITHPITRPMVNAKGHASAITALAISSDHAHAATGDADGELRVWSLAPLANVVQTNIAIDADPVAMACEVDAHHLPQRARLITDPDAKALPELASRIGEDVCAGATN